MRPRPTPTPLVSATPGPSASPSPAPRPTEVALFLGGFLSQTGEGGERGVLRSLDGGATWELALPFGSSLFFCDSLRGWAAGDRSLFRTVDGGRTWSSELGRVPLPRSGLGPLAFADLERGAMLAATPDPDEFQDAISFLHTPDGGRTWSVTHRLDPCRRSTRRMCLTRGGHGLALLCDQQTLLRTGDAGESWTEASFPAPLSTGAGARLSCSGDSDFWLMEGLLAWHSPDGGRTWREQPLPGPAFTTRDVSFVTPDLGWAVATVGGATSGTIVLRTTDGGTSWEEQFRSGDLGLAGPTVHFEDVDHGMVSTSKAIFHSFGPPTNRPVVWVTDDGGGTWLRRDLDELGDLHPYFAEIGSIALPPADLPPPPEPTPVPTGPLVFLTFRDSGLFRSDDGGLAWAQVLHLPPGQQLYGVELVDRTLGFAVGDSGILLETTDAGATWASRHATGPAGDFRRTRLYTARFFDRDRGVVGGQQDPNFAGVSATPALFFTRDGGDTWSPATIIGLPDDPVGLFPRSLCVRPSGLALAGDQFSTRYASGGGLAEGVVHRMVLVSHDFGVTWLDVADLLDAPANFIIREVACASDSDLWLLGGLQDVGTQPATPFALHSADAGETWAEVDVPLPAEMSLGRSVSSASFLGPLDGWLAAGPIGDHLALLATRDGGSTFDELLFSEEPVFDNVRVRRLDAARAVVAGSEQIGVLRLQPRVLVTSDGGRTWTSVALSGGPGTHAFLDVAATDDRRSER